MDFFGQQSSTRLRSNILILGFLAALVATGALLHFSIAFIAVAMGLMPSVFVLSAPVAVLIGLCWVAILAGCFFRYLDVRAGGPALARRFGAEPAAGLARDEQARQLCHIVQEVSIAATTPAPEVFVLRRETSVNAFVLGAKDNQRAIVVTQGALDAFDRDELQAVVAHEFGHIVHGDLVINMRLLIALGGLMALDEIGQLLIGSNSLKSLLRRERDSTVHPGMLVGLLMRALGSVGVLFGSVLRSAISRQREFLADATAVQFTRMPIALASALTTVNEVDDDVALHMPQAKELLHLCFSNTSSSWYKRIYSRLFATHPPLQSRIDAIDPHFSVKRRKRRTMNDNAPNSVSASSQRVPVGPAMVMTTAAMAGMAGASGLAANEDSNATEVQLSDRIQLLLPDERSCLAALFAFFVPEDALRRREFLDAVAFNFDRGFANAIDELRRSLPVELEADRVDIVTHASGVLKHKLALEPRRHVIKKLEQLITAFDGEDLMSYACLQLIRRELDIEFPVAVTRVTSDGDRVDAQGGGIKTFEAMGEEFALLLSLIVDASGAQGVLLENTYRRVLSCYTDQAIERRRADEPGIVKALESAFQTVYVQPQAIRNAFVEHCVEIVMYGGKITRREHAMLELFAASLGCKGVALPEPDRVHRAA